MVERKFSIFNNSKRLNWFYAAMVSIATFLVYLPSLKNGFVNWDDQNYVYNNPHLKSLDVSTIKWAFTAFYADNWHPLTWLSYLVDHALWGMSPFGHHLSNLLLHGLNTWLVVMLAIRLARNAGLEDAHDVISVPLATGLITGLLFGLHPLHVESVAWISERKDVLCAFFFLLGLHCYLEYATAASSVLRRYFLCLLMFALALMSKPMAVTFPLVLLLLDLYPLERLSLRRAFSTGRAVLLEKIPFCALAAATCLLTLLAQKQAVQTVAIFPWGQRLWMALRALGFYLDKMILPIGLVPFYPYPKEMRFLSAGSLFAILPVVAVAISCVWMTWKKRKFWTIAWTYYLITLLPVLGIIQVGVQAAADRYTYLPSLGPFLLAGGLAAQGMLELGKRYNPRPGRLAVIVSVLLLAGTLSALTVKQTPIWKDSIALWNAELRVYPDNDQAYLNLGNYYYHHAGAIDKAIRLFGTALKINPKNARAYYERALAYEDLGEYRQALDDYSQAITDDPDYQPAYVNRGLDLANRGDYQDAIRDFDRGIDLNPQDALAYLDRALVEERLGATKNAMKDFRAAAHLGNSQARKFLSQTSLGG